MSMDKKKKTPDSNLITVTGTLSGSINGVTINGTVTGTADRSTGHVTNVYHGIDPAIGPELSRIVLGLTIVCANMAVEVGPGRNLNSMAPLQSMQRIATFTLPSHSMQCLQTVAWQEPNVAVVTMAYSGTLPSFSGASLPIPDVLSEFRQTGPQTIHQSGTTQATFDGSPQPLSVDIQYSINGPKIAWSTPLGSQFLENANNTSSYDETTQEITYNTDVRMLKT
ncbi:hypothetical protein ACIQU2_07430 [Pseudomonas sp. NPDC098740]|uniref:hypothetical protein n=1 Tax=Pseudomonas sp. NPDC098740 TaxID=3364486 RepID=UPI003839E29C